MFPALARLIWRFPLVFLSLTLLAVAGAAWYSADVFGRLTLDPGWDVPDSGSAQARRALRDELGKDETLVVLLFSPKDKTLKVDDPAYRDAAEAVLAGIGRNPDVRGMKSYFANADPAMKSLGGDMSYAMVWLARGPDEGIGAYRRLRGQLASDVLTVETGGELATYVDAREHLEHDVRRAEWVSFALLAVLLVWVFGSFTAAALPLVVGGASIAVSAAMLKFCAQYTEISIYTVNVVSMLGLGLAIDYALFVVSRYREELALGGEMERVLGTTLRTAGRTVAFSGLTVAASLFCLLLMPQRFFQNMGLAGGISVAAAMLASILILPALLALLGTRIDRRERGWWRRLMGRPKRHDGWDHFSHYVMRHPRRVLAASLLLLGVMGLPILHMEIGPADSRSLPADAESRRVQESLEQAFPDAELNPLVLSLHTRGPAASGDGLAAQYRLARQLETLEGVARVAGLTSLDASLSLDDYRLLYAHPDQFPLASASLEQYTRGDRALMLVYYRADPASSAARDLVRRIRALSPPEGMATLRVGGFPAEHLDYVDSLRAWAPKVVAAIVAVIAVLLFLMLGSVVLPVKAVLTNLISLSATFGGLVWIFQDGNLAQWLDFTPQGKLEGTVLVLIFASAFGLSIDYEVFLLSRIRELRGRTASDARAIAGAMRCSGPIITRAALLIGIVLGTFAMGDLVFMKAMGIGLLISVIVDATLVRMLLVPATLRLLGRRMWWAPAPLRVLYDRHISHAAPPH